MVCAGGDWADLRAGDPASRINQALDSAATSARYQPQAHAIVTGRMKKWQPVTVSFLGPELSEDGNAESIHRFPAGSHLSAWRQKVRRARLFRRRWQCRRDECDLRTLLAGALHAGRSGRVEFPRELPPGATASRFPRAHGGRAAAFDGLTGSFTIASADKTAPGFYAKGQLEYVGERYLRFAETGEPWLKGGADSPENFLAYADFDDTTPTHKYAPHAGDWRPGDPTWQSGKGKNIIGALNYLAVQAQ